MRKEGMTPDVVSFSAILLACEKGGQWERALPLVEKTGMTLDAISFSAALSAYEKGGQWERALSSPYASS